MATPSPSPTPSKRKASPTPPTKAFTAAEQERLDKLREYARRGGLGNKQPRLGDYKNETQAFDLIRDKWAYISHKLADKALQAARSSKNINGKELVALCTSAGIAYDKRWSKATADTTEIAMPASLVRAITSKLVTGAAKLATTNDVSLLGQVQDMEQTEPNDIDASPAHPVEAAVEAEAGG